MESGFHREKNSRGWVEVVSGCMYSGKTEELIRQIRRAELARQKYLVFKPRIDDRYSETEVMSHSQLSCPSIVIDRAEEIYSFLRRDTQVIGIDEGQFFDHTLVEVVGKLAGSGRRVIIAGLDTDWRARPFGPMPQLMAVAEVVKKQYAICMTCGQPATRTQRLSSSEDDILVGSTNLYEARCRDHHSVGAENVNFLVDGDSSEEGKPSQLGR